MSDSPAGLKLGSSSAELLLRCLSVSRDAQSRGRATTVDWNEVVDIAVSRGLAPLLFKRLKQDGTRVQVPADAWKRLRKVYFDGASANTRLYRKLGPVLHRLRNSDTPVIVLKGAYLAEAVYGDVALRPMGDVDLLVREADLAGAQQVLLDLGGVHQQFEDIESSIKWKHHLPQMDVQGLAVEIHWTIASPVGPVRADIAGLWNRARPHTVSGVEVLAPSPEDLMLHLCLHACYENHLAELLNLCDIAETVERFGARFDWGRLAEVARGWGATRYVGLALHMARTMLGAGVPEKALELLIHGGLDRRICEAARQSVLSQTGYDQWQPFFDKMGAASLGDKARLSWRRVFLPRGEMFATYPASRDSHYLYFYYARRVGHAVGSYAAHTLRRAHLIASSPERENRAGLVRWLNSGKP